MTALLSNIQWLCIKNIFITKQHSSARTEHKASALQHRKQPVGLTKLVGSFDLCAVQILTNAQLFEYCFNDWSTVSEIATVLD